MKTEGCGGRLWRHPAVHSSDDEMGLLRNVSMSRPPQPQPHYLSLPFTRLSAPSHQIPTLFPPECFSPSSSSYPFNLKSTFLLRYLTDSGPQTTKLLFAIITNKFDIKKRCYICFYLNIECLYIYVGKKRFMWNS